MIKNYLKVAFRTLWKNKEFSFINIGGLAIGISTCMLITLFVLDELSFDSFHEKRRRIYRLTEVLHLPKEVRPQAVTSPPMAPALRANFPEVESAVRLTVSSRVLARNDQKFYDTRIWYCDSTLFDIFTFPMIEGNAKTALVNPYSIVLTERAAKKYFGDEHALGKLMTLSDTVSLTVTGVIRNIPANSHLQFDVLLSRATYSEFIRHQPETNWFNNGSYTYILLREGNSPRDLEAKFPDFLEKQMDEPRKKNEIWYDLVLQPVTDIHLRSNMGSELAGNGNIKYIYIFSVVAALVLLIACANYINLATARSMSRAKELGMRKVIGARRMQLTFQLMGESLLVTFLASIVALVVITVALPGFNELTGKQMEINNLMMPGVVASFAAVFVFIGIVAGAYPAFIMSSFSPIRTLKSGLHHGRENGLLRKGLVVFQFSISIILIAGSILIYRQMDFMRNQKLGLERDQVIELGMRSTVISKEQLIKDEMAKVPGVLSLSATDFSYGNGISNIAVLPDGAAENEITSEAVISIDYDFLKTFRIGLIAGRDFAPEFKTDENEGFLVNEAAVKHFGWGSPENAIGKSLDWGLGKKGKVVGVTRDFNFYSMHESIRPLIMHIYPAWHRFIAVKVEAANVTETIEQLRRNWATLNLDSPFDYNFVDKDFEAMYKAEQQTQTIIGLLSCLAIFIASLGLFGLAAFTAEQRVKEIGVRKVLGADVFGVVGLLSGDFLRLVLVSIVVAVPIAWIATNRWLEGFAYRTETSWWIFAIAAISAILIALITVSFQSIKAALANPIDSLRTE